MLSGSTGEMINMGICKVYRGVVCGENRGGEDLHLDFIYDGPKVKLDEVEIVPDPDDFKVKDGKYETSCYMKMFKWAGTVEDLRKILQEVWDQESYWWCHPGKCEELLFEYSHYVDGNAD